MGLLPRAKRELKKKTLLDAVTRGKIVFLEGRNSLFQKAKIHSVRRGKIRFSEEGNSPYPKGKNSFFWRGKFALSEGENSPFPWRGNSLFWREKFALPKPIRRGKFVLSASTDQNCPLRKNEFSPTEGQIFALRKCKFFFFGYTCLSPSQTFPLC